MSQGVLRFCATTVFLHDQTMEQTLDLLAGLGFDAVEWRCRNNPPHAEGKPTGNWGRHLFDCNPAWLAEHGAELGRATRAAGLELGCLAANAAPGDLATMELLARGAAAAGAAGVRVGFSVAAESLWREGYGALQARAADELGGVVKIFSRYGVRAIIETHPNTLHVSASMALRLAERFRPEEVGICWDWQNAPQEGFEPVDLGVCMLGRYLQHVHMAGRRWAVAGPGAGFGTRWECQRCSMGEGQFDLVAGMQALLRAGYGGLISLEDFGSAGDALSPAERAARGIGELRAAYAAAQAALTEGVGKPLG